MRIADFINRLIHQIIPDCFFSIFRRRHVVRVHYQNHAIPICHHHLNSRVRVTFQEHQTLTNQLPFSQPVPITHYHIRPVMTPSVVPAPIHLPIPVPQNSLLQDLHQQQTSLQRENEQLFVQLTQNHGQIYARSPVDLSVENAAKQQQLTETQQKLRHLLQFAYGELNQVIDNALEARNHVSTRLAEIRIQLAHEPGNISLREHYNGLTSLESALIDLERRFHHYQQSQRQQQIPQTDEEIRISSLLNNIERLNRQKTILQHCQLNDAGELQQLLAGLENEYQDLNQKWERAKQDLTNSERTIQDLTEHLLNILALVERFEFRYFIEVRPRLNTRAAQINQVVNSTAVPRTADQAQVVGNASEVLRNATNRLNAALTSLTNAANKKGG